MIENRIMQRKSMKENNATGVRTISFFLIIFMLIGTVLPLGLEGNSAYAQESSADSVIQFEDESLTDSAIQIENESSTDSAIQDENSSDISSEIAVDEEQLTTFAAGSISGKVTNSSGNPIAGISVSVYSYYADSKYWLWEGMSTTNANGTYTISGLSPRGYRVYFSDDRARKTYINEYYDNASSVESGKTVTVSSGANTANVNAQLANGGSIEGTVTNSRGGKLESIEVAAYLYDNAAKKWVISSFTFTDKNGNFYLGGLAAGKYRIEYYDLSEKHSPGYWKNSNTIAAGTDISVSEGQKISAINAQLKYRAGWQYILGKWYYYNSAGVMQTGWKYISGYWYYLEKHSMNTYGSMQTGWTKVNQKWYYMLSSGEMRVGWQFVGKKWYYLDSSGAMKTGWIKSNGRWYYLQSSGAMQTGWVKVNQKWYYLNSSGEMTKGWQYVGNKWYYMNSSGQMLTGTQKIGKKTYRFHSSGVWIG